MSILKVKNYGEFVGSLKGMSQFINYIENYTEQPVSELDFEGVTIIKNAHANIFKFAVERNIKLINLSKRDLEIFEQLKERHDIENEISIPDFNEAKEEYKKMYEEGNFYLYTNLMKDYKQRGVEENNLCYVDKIMDRGICISVFYNKRLFYALDQGLPISLKDNSMIYKTEVSWFNLFNKECGLRKLNQEEIKVVNRIMLLMLK